MLTEKAKNLISDDFFPSAIGGFNSALAAKKEYSRYLSPIYEKTEAAARGIKTALGK